LQEYWANVIQTEFNKEPGLMMRPDMWFKYLVEGREIQVLGGPGVTYTASLRDHYLAFASPIAVQCGCFQPGNSSHEAEETASGVPFGGSFYGLMLAVCTIVMRSFLTALADSHWPAWLPERKSDAPPLWLIFWAFILAAFSQGLSGFGQAIIWNFLMQLGASVLGMDYSLEKTVSLLVGGDVFAGVVLVWLGRKSIHWRLLAMLGAPILIFSIAGNAALVHLNVVILERGVGLMLLCYSLRRWMELQKPVNALSEPEATGSLPPMWMIMLCGAFAGFVGGCTGICGPFLAVLFAQTRLDKSEIRATFQCVVLSVAVLNTGLLVQEGRIDVKSDIAEYVVMVIAGTLGVALGNKAHHSVDEEFVRWVVLILIIAASCTMIAVGDLTVTLILLANLFLGMALAKGVLENMRAKA
jgi:uncharacterized membrane protein YfcA